MGRPRKDSTDVAVYIRVPLELAELIRADAKANERDISGQIRLILAEKYRKAKKHT